MGSKKRGFIKISNLLISNATPVVLRIEVILGTRFDNDKKIQFYLKIISTQLYFKLK